MSSSPGTVPVSPCPSGAELSAFAVGKVSTAEQERIGAHVEGCAACLAALEAASPTHDSLVGRLRAQLPGELFSPPPVGGASTVDDLGAGRAAAPPAGDIALPRTFGDYELLRELGRGGMGVVYLARQVSAGRLVALKLVRPDSLKGRPAEEQSEIRERFRSEAQAAAGLSHDHIVPVFEVGEHDDCPFYSMRYIEGQSLKEVLREGPVPARQAAVYLEAVARAVQHAHEHRILHRDLKPGNILLDAEGRPHVTDFGLAKRLGSHDLTQTGRGLGTLGYAPPEQVRDASRVGVAGDVYSLGATLYHLLSGRPPFQAASEAEILDQIKEREPVPPRQLNPAIPRDLETIALKCLQKEPGRRYASAQDLANDLGRYLRGEPIRARPVGRIERAWRWCRRRPGLAFMGAVAVAALVAVTVVSLVYAAEKAAFAAEKAADVARLEKSAAKLQAESLRNQQLARERAAESERNRKLARASTNLFVRSVIDEMGRRPKLQRAYTAAATYLEATAGLQSFPEIIDAQQRALTALAAEAPKDAEIPKQQRLLANLCSILGGFATEDGRAEDAEGILKRAVTAWELVVQRDPREAEGANELANALYSLGAHARDAGELDRMDELWKRAAAVSEKITGRKPHQTANLGFTCYNQGVTASKKGKWDEVIERQTRAIDLLAPLHRDGFEREKVGWFLSSAHLGRALAWREKREYARALPDFEKAAELASAEDGPRYRLQGVAVTRNDVGDAEGAAAAVEATLKSAPKNAENLKTAAQVYGRCAEVVAHAAKVPAARREKLRASYTGRAVELLRQARAAGAYRGAAGAKELRADLNFLAIHGDAGFLALLKELEQEK